MNDSRQRLWVKGEGDIHVLRSFSSEAKEGMKEHIKETKLTLSPSTFLIELTTADRTWQRLVAQGKHV
ncbi:hypothetical protein EYF80_062356 [Liparis tanakae]|uniref:Uncharacterized protein n=1 Tax=Liparis tanakae TaxID=230148 RepID=A0A4Z2EG39_9TELE|nr:hypothetical protein EYF80_062356 [Liparis tanakae]